jgi:adenylate cyclase
LPPSEARCRSLGCVQPYGMSQPTMISELLPPADQSAVSDQHIADSEAAAQAMAQGDWPRARRLLERLPASDGPRAFLLSYMAACNDQPPTDWKGTMVLQK